MRACRIDANQPEIVKYFRSHGFAVLLIHTLKNCADIIISYSGNTAVIEIKDGKKPPSQRKLTEGEFKFKNEWLGQYFICESIEDADKIIEKLKEKQDVKN